MIPWALYIKASAAMTLWSSTGIDHHQMPVYIDTNSNSELPRHTRALIYQRVYQRSEQNLKCLACVSIVPMYVVRK